MRVDFIPRPDANFDRFFVNLHEKVIEGVRTGLWTHIPKEDIGQFDDQYLLWREVYDRVLGPHTSPETREKQRARIQVERYMRGFINRFLRWPPVTDLERDEMGINNPKQTRASVGKPQTPPVLEGVISVARQLSFYFRDKGASSHGKPDGVHSIEFRWSILDAPPKSIDELFHVEHDTSNPHVIEFTECERGKRVYVAARWRNSKEEAGPWSDEIYSFVIP